MSNTSNQSQETQETLLVSDQVLRRLAGILAVLVALELAFGIASLFGLPIGRPSGLAPMKTDKIYLVHAGLGLPLAILTPTYLLLVRRKGRTLRMVGWVGGIGVVAAGTGGLLTLVQPVRVLGMILMLAGGLTALFGYLIPLLDNLPSNTRLPPPTSTQPPPSSW
ncbi:MAG: hypothetical protein ACYDGN_11025 [Acidimicrobiales bacterium]